MVLLFYQVIRVTRIANVRRSRNVLLYMLCRTSNQRALGHDADNALHVYIERDVVGNPSSSCKETDDVSLNPDMASRRNDRPYFRDVIRLDRRKEEIR